MNENTTFANSRPRSVKPKKRTGFTMMEMMITLAIMAILFGLAVPAVAAIQKNLEIARLNSYAKDIYLAAQNRLISLRATGELTRDSDLSSVLEKEGCWYTLDVTKDSEGNPTGLTARKPHDWDFENADGTENQNYVGLYGVMHDPHALADDVQNRVISKYLVPEVSVTSSTLDGYYYIEFNPLNGDVYAVFYTDAKTGFTAENIHDYTTTETTGGTTVEPDENGRRSAFRKEFPTDAGKIMLGYYRGDPTDLLEENGPTDFTPTCEIVNKEDLYIKVTCDLLNPVNVALFKKGYGTSEVTLKDEQGHQVVIPLCLSLDKTPMQLRDERAEYAGNANNPFVWTGIGADITAGNTLTAYILLDSLDDAANFDALIDAYGGDAGFKETFRNGCNLEATANFEMKIGSDVYKTIPQEEVKQQHSRFGAVQNFGTTEVTVDVSYVRHLKNLNGYGEICQDAANDRGGRLIINQKGIDFIPRIGDDGEQVLDEVTGKPIYDEVPPNIHYTPYYVSETAGADVKWYWDSTYLVGEPPKGTTGTTSLIQNPIKDAGFKPIELFVESDGSSTTVEYNGNGYGLYDFDIKGDEDEPTTNIGLFGSVENATFSEVNLIDPIVTGGDADNVGGLVGYADNSKFYNCGVRLTYEDPCTGSRYENARNHVATHAVTAGAADNVGGMVGYALKSEFESSYAALQVVADDAAGNVGGLVGYLKSQNNNAARKAFIQDCYTSELTSGGTNTGGMAGRLSNVGVGANANGTERYVCYATGDVSGADNVGGFVGNCEYVDFRNRYSSAGGGNYYAYGKVTGTGAGNVGGFVGYAYNSSFVDASGNDACFYLRQTGCNNFDHDTSDPSGVMYKTIDDLTENRTEAEEIVCTSLSHPYVITEPMFPFPMARTAVDGGEFARIDHYGDWPVVATIQTCLVYYEKYDDGSYGVYGTTSLVGDNETANTWNVDTLLRGDVECVEDGYAVLSSSSSASIKDSANGNTCVTGSEELKGKLSFVSTVAEGLSRSENMYLYPLTSDYQGMSQEYADEKQSSSGKYFEKLVATIDAAAYTFFYCPVLAKSAINPTPDELIAPPTTTAEEKASDVFGLDSKKPDQGIVRSARQLNAIGRMPWFWSMNFSQECHVNFGTYTKSYCGTAIDLSGSGQTTSNMYRNKPIGNNINKTKTPYTGTYNGNSFRIIDYCLYTTGANDSLDAGLFGVLYKGKIKNVVLMASDPNPESGAGTAWVKSDMTQGSDAYHIAPLVGAVEYNSAAYGSATGTARSLKVWNISGETIYKYAIEGNKFTLEGYNNTGDGGKWSTVKSQYVPQNTQQYMEITLKGNFGTVTGATMTSKKTINGSPVTYSGPTSASSIKDGEIKFRLEMTDCTLETDDTDGTSKRNIGDDVTITLTGGDLTNWAVSNSSFTAELFSTEPVVPTGDDPASYITGIANMSTVSNCAVAGYIVDYVPAGTQNQEVQIGGLVGKNQGEIYNCSAANKRLSATGSSGNNVRYIGGFAGVNKEGIIANCYAGGQLVPGGTQSAFVGGVVGQQQKDGDAPAWCTANTKLLDSYSYCTMTDNDNATFAGVANGSDSMILHSHFYNDLSCFRDYSKDDHPFTAFYNKLSDKGKVYSTTIRGKAVQIPYSMRLMEMKKLFRGSAFALTGDTGTAEFDHSWPYDQSLVGQYLFPAVVLDDDGYYVHYGDWPAPTGTIYTNQTSFGGVYWSDFCIDATFKTDYNYYWGDWLKEMKYQIGLGDFKEGDYIEIIVEPEFKWDAPEAAGLFQCGVHSMLEDTSKNVWDEANDVAYESQGINFSNGQVYQFVFDVDKATLNILNDPQLWFAINYHQKGGIDGQLWDSVKGNYTDPDDGSPAGNEDPFRLNRLMVNIYRDSSTSKTENTTTRHSTTSSQPGETTSEEDLTHLEVLKTWNFEPVNGVPATNILSTDKGPMVAGVIAENAGLQATGHSNKITLSNADSFRMNISDAFHNELPLKKNECYQVEATFALGPGATDDMSMRPYLVSGDDKFYANNYTLVQKRSDTGANAGKTIWANALYTFGGEGVTISDDAYIVWIPRDAGKTLTGDLYVDDVVVKKVAQGADPSATSSAKPTVPADDTEAKLVAYWSTNSASDISAPTYETTAKNNYRYINFQSAKDLTSNLTWSQFVDAYGVLSDTQYMMVTLTYPDDYAHAEKNNFTFTCDSIAYTSADGNRQILNEIDPASGDDAFDADNRMVKWIVGGPLDYSDLYKYRDAAGEENRQLNLRSFIAYRNQFDLTDNRVLTDNKDDFVISIGIYDRDPNATAITVPTTTASRTTKQLSGGTAVHTFAADQLGRSNYMTFGGDDTGYVDGDRTKVMTWNEFANMVGALGDTQYMRVTLNNADAPFGTLDPNGQTIRVNTYRGVDGKIIKGEKAKSVNATTVVYQVNGPMDLNTVATDGAKEGYNDAGFTFDMASSSGEVRVGDKTSILVEIMSTATTAQLQGDNFDVLADDVVSKTVTITLNGDTFSSGLELNSDITDWFTGLGGRGLSAKLLSVNGNVAQISIVGTVTNTPASDVTVTVTVPGDATTKGGNDIVASGSFVISKKEPKASIAGDETVRSFFVNEERQTAVVNISVANTTITDNLGSVGDWYTGTLPTGLELSQVAKINDNTVTLTFSGTPTEQCSVPLTFKVPAVAVACNTELTAGTLTFNVVSRPEVTVTFGLKEGTYKGTRTVSISSDPTDATIEYNLDNGGWKSYVLPVTLTDGEHTLQARATKTGYKTVEAQANYTIEHDDNLLKNGYFDDGMDGWTFNPSSADVKVVNEVLTVTDFQAGNVLEITGSLKDGVTLKPDTKYRLSFIMNADTGLVVKVNPGGNSSISYTASGNYEFTTGPASEMSKFKVYISAPKDQPVPVSGTFDNFELVEVGGSTPTTPTESSQSETSQSQTEPVVTSQSESSESSTSEPTGERTKKAQWVTTGGISYTYFRSDYGETYMDVYGNCSGKKDGTTDMTWREFLASIGDVSANQYFEIAFTHASGTSFYNVANDGTKTTMDNTGYNPTTTTLLSADDVKVLFETNGALAYTGDSNPQLKATLRGTNGAPQNNTDIICTVTLWEGDHGGSGGETSESETSTSETSETSTSETSEPETFTNLIKNGNFANGLNGWKATGLSGDEAVVTGGQLVVNKAEAWNSYMDASFTETIKPHTEYTIRWEGSGLSNTKVSIHIADGDGSGSYKSMDAPGTLTFTTGDLSTADVFRVRIQCTNSTTATGTFDNFILVEGDHIPDIDDPNPPADTYTVTVNGGNVDKTTATAGETITLTPPTTAPEGKEFKGWKVTAGGVTVTNNTFTMPAANVTIEAEYQYIEYSITVYNGNANGKTTAHVGETIQLNAGAPETGKVFAGWTVTSPAGLTLADASATMTTFTMPAADVVVEATSNWVEHNVTIHVNNDAWGSASILTGVTKAHYGEQLTLTVSPAAGYELSAISVKNNVTTVGADNTFSMANSDVDIYVDFVKSVLPTHSVTITGGIVNGGTGTATIAEGETVSITANTPDAGYAFTGWTVTSPSGLTLVSTTASTTSFVMPTSDVKITANFEKQNYNVTLGTVSNGSIAASKAKAQIGDAVTLTATPATGYVFKSWSVTAGTLSSSTTSPATLTMPASDVIVTATFEKQTYAVTVSNDTTKGTASADKTTAAYGDTVTLSAVANKGYTFTGWTSDDVTITNATAASASFTMPAKAVTVTANYVVDPNAAIASWTTKSGISRTYYNGGTSTMEVAYNTTGLDNNNSEISFATFVENNGSIGANQYMKITYTKSNGKFGNARRAATSLTMNAYAGGSYKVAYADDVTIVIYVKGTCSSTIDQSFATSWTNASAVPGNDVVTCKVEIFNFTTDPLASISEADKTQNYTVTVTGGTASPASAAPGTSVTVTPTVESGTRFTGWTVDGIDYLYDATVAPGSTANPLTFTMPYNNVKLTANFETVETEPTQPPVTGNLLINGNFTVVPVNADQWGFKFNDEGIGWKNGGIAQEESTFTSGSYTIKNGNDSTKALYQEIAFSTAKTYTITLNVNVTAGPLDIRLYNGKTMVQSVGTIAAGTSGTQTFTFTPSAAADSIYLGGGGAAYTITSAVLTESGSTPVTDPVVTEPTQTPVTGNLIKNGDFSQGTAEWSSTATTFEVIGGVAHVTAGNDDTKGIKQTVALNVGSSYTISGVVTGSANLWIGGTCKPISSGTFSETFTATESSTLILFSGYNMSFTLDDIVLVGEGGSTPTQATTQAPKYKVTLGSVTGGTISASKTTDVAEGEEITLTATPASGYTFGGWNVTGATVANASNVSTTFTMPAGNVTVSATFNEDTPVGGGTLTVNAMYKPSKYGDPVAIPSDNISPSTSVGVSGSTATITVVYPQVYDPSADGNSYLTLTANGAPVAFSSFNISTEAGHNHDVTFVFNVPVNGNTAIAIDSVEATFKIPTITIS